RARDRRARVAADELDDRLVRADLEPLAREDGARRAEEVRVVAREPFQQPAHLGLRLRDRLAGQRPALGLEHAALRVARVLLAAGDDRRVDRAGPEEL